MIGRFVTRSAAVVACLLTVLVIGALAVVACGGGETTFSTLPAAASPSPTASASRVVWANPRSAVSYARANPPSTARTPTSQRAKKAGTVGWDFQPTVDIEVTALGCFDAGRDGLARAHRVGIFDAYSNRLLASVTVRPKSRLDGFFRWESLETPLVLTAGLHYVMGTEDKETLETVYTRRGWPEEEWGPQPGEHWAAEIGRGRMGLFVNRPSEAAFTAPTFTQDLWNDAPWFSPNFKFRPASSASPAP
jgi:hypothetical protein